MAESNYTGVTSREVLIQDGHQVIYDFNLHHLDLIEKTFFPLEYETWCLTVPTSWKIELKCVRVPGNNGLYTFSVKLKRVDDSNRCVKASLHVSFYDVRGRVAFPPLISSKDIVEHDDELEDGFGDIPSADISHVVLVKVVIMIKRCHTETNFQ
ncbi:unnamed protein product [Larinioides sclopetarius]|uniref:MATH domain-containing protein n=1 Tax=Larinioides sclopetarius TaxID=280406 RepID=A0AAV1ZCK4_9ARAC